jgi:hypothetical protein
VISAGLPYGKSSKLGMADKGQAQGIEFLSLPPGEVGRVKQHEKSRLESLIEMMWQNR